MNRMRGLRKMLDRTLWILSMVMFVFTQEMVGQNKFDGVVSFDKTIHDFGDILISDGEQRCVFILTNISDEPVVIHRVISSCGCTEPEWTKSPVRPGEKGKIEITFKNDQGPYPFDKAITVYVTNVSKPISLRIRGVAHEKKKTLQEMFPERFGAVGLKNATLSIGQIEQGEMRVEKVEIANLSRKSVEVSFSKVTPGAQFSVSPSVIPPQGKATLTYSVDTKNTGEKLWGNNTFGADVVIDGKSTGKRVEIEGLIKENFSGYSQEQKRTGPLPQFVSSSASIGDCNGKEIKKVKFTFTNVGKGEFRIYKMDSSEKGCSFSYPEVTAGGKKGEIEVKVDTSKGSGEMLYIISVITNSPTRPIINLFITGNIEK